MCCLKLATMMKNYTTKSMLHENIKTPKFYKDFFLKVISHNEQYPYSHIFPIRTQDSSIMTRHQIIDRMITSQSAGWFGGQKVIK